jgi:two-component system CheB/CheR fusion protein
VQTAQIGEWDWDILSGTIQKTDHVCKLLGMQPGKSQDQAGPFFHLIHEDDKEMVREQMKTALEGLNIFHTECRILRVDNGQIKWVSIYGRIIAHQEGRPARMIGVVYDITDRKRLEKHKDNFISVASHELKTPVTSIKAYSEILQDLFEDTNDQPNVDIVKKLNNQVDRLVKLIQSLLDSTNVSEGRLRLFPQTFDLNKLIEQQVLESQLVSPHHELTWNPSDIPLVHADKDRIGQVITNFISNAVKYSPRKSKVFISSEDALDGVIVRVRDSGMGITPEDQERIFQQYYRVNTEEVLRNEGLGIGLYISSEIIKQHGGNIGVESIAGEGSTFYFKLLYS